jgi:hypothetical protein
MGLGVGDSFEAAFTLAAPLPAGVWHLIGDGYVLAATDIRYEVLWRRAGSDTSLVEFRHHFDPQVSPGGWYATNYDGDGMGIAADARAGDQLVLRMSVSDNSDGGTGTVFIPNGDGPLTHGRIPSLILPR